MEFTTTDGKLILNGTEIKQKRLTNARRRNIGIYAFLMLFFIDLTRDKINIATEAGTLSSWILVGFYGLIWIIPLLFLFDFLFRQSLESKLDVHKIDKIRVSDEGLETNVIVTMKSKRYKPYIFRTLENQYDSFVENLRLLNPNIKITWE